jgi:hypothetical protein
VAAVSGGFGVAFCLFVGMDINLFQNRLLYLLKMVFFVS